jgi:hypothetical protein
LVLESSQYPNQEEPEKGTALHVTESSAGFGAQVPAVSGTEVREFVVLELTPEVLCRVQSRSIGGKPFHLDAPLPGLL